MIKLAKSAKLLRASAMQRSLNILNQGEYISFALGLPANEALPLNLLQKSAADYSDNCVMQYSPPLNNLKSQIKNLVRERGINCDEEEIFITTGAQQGINLLTRLLTDKEGCVVTEELVYPGFLQVIQSIGARVIAIPTNYKTGMDLDRLEATIKKSKIKPALIYIVVDGSNPLGVSLNLEHRKKLVSIAKEYDIPILEDDPYGFLYYEQQSYPALKALEKDYVCYIGSFSKIIAPALRVGWIIVPKHLLPKLSILKESSDVDTATFSQRIVSKFIEDNYLLSHFDKIRRLYKEKRDIMNYCIKKYLPTHTQYLVPKNGIYFWLEFSQTIDTKILFQKVLEKKVIIIPGSAFSALGTQIANNSIRLNFSFSSNSEIEEGIKRISQVKF